MFDKTEKELARNSKDPEELHNLALTCGWDVQAIVAINKHTRTDTLRYLAGFKGFNWRCLQTWLNIADNPNTPIDILENWSKPDLPSNKRQVFDALFGTQQATNTIQGYKVLLAQHAMASLMKRMQTK